jgi:hypothetical protein
LKKYILIAADIERRLLSATMAPMPASTTAATASIVRR